MSIQIPGVNSKYSTADIILEQKLLCEANIDTIRKLAHVRTEREINDEVNRRIRLANDFLGMAGSRKMGCLYHEKEMNNVDAMCEHVVPMSVLVDLYHTGNESFEKLVLYPIARISKVSDNELNRIHPRNTGCNLENPFRRYEKPRIKIVTHTGKDVDLHNWSMRDHWNLVLETTELEPILEVLEIRHLIIV